MLQGSETRMTLVYVRVKKKEKKTGKSWNKAKGVNISSHVVFHSTLSFLASKANVGVG